MAREKDKLKKAIEFAQKNNVTYAQMQIKESLKLVEPFSIPKGYTKIGDRKKNGGEK